MRTIYEEEMKQVRRSDKSVYRFLQESLEGITLAIMSVHGTCNCGGFGQHRNDGQLYTTWICRNLVLLAANVFVTLHVDSLEQNTALHMYATIRL